MKRPLKKDLLISVVAHLALAAILIILSPSTGMFRGKPEIMNISLAEFNPPGSSSRAEATEAIQPLATAKPLADEKVDETYKLDSPNKREKIDKTEARKDKAKGDGRGGIDITSKVGAGSESGEGANIGGSNLPYNLGLVLSIIERAWRNPVTSPTIISCTIYCQIDRSGNLIGEPLIEKSSGIAVFDQSAIFAIKRAEQFPPFPVDFDYDYIGLHLDFEYAP